MPGPEYVHVMQGVSKSWPGGRQVLRDISLSFLPGAKIGVLGANGAGKSTLLRILAGLDRDISGESLTAAGIRVGYLPQEPALDPERDVLGNIMDGVRPVQDMLDRFEALSARFLEPLDEAEMQALIEEQGEVQQAIDAADGWNLGRNVEAAMDALRCPPGTGSTATLSGGEKRRVALCRLLLEKPDMLLLDEPTNHLDAEAVAWLEHYLHACTATVIAVTHDRYFLDNVAGWILELDRGQGIPWRGNYSSWLAQKERRLAQEEREDQARRRTIRNELDWINSTPRARQAKSRARIRAYEELLAQEREQRTVTRQIIIPPGERLGDLVIECSDLCKGYGDRQLIRDLSFRMPPGAVTGIIGPNGAGKTTLFRMITGQESPDSGSLRIGETVTLGYVDQSRDTLDDEKTVWEEISGGDDVIRLGRREVPSRAYAGNFNFRGAAQQQRVGLLSGGERNRVHLAKMLKTGANVLLLDEPTNDLDVDTLRALEEAIENFPGCVLVISHDRWFLDRIATHVLAFAGDGQVRWFEGNFQEYEADRARHAGGDKAGDAPAATRHRGSHKPFSRR